MRFADLRLAPVQVAIVVMCAVRQWKYMIDSADPAGKVNQALTQVDLSPDRALLMIRHSKSILLNSLPGYEA